MRKSPFALPDIPQPQQFPERPDIGHGQIQPAAHRPVCSRLPLPARASVYLEKILVRVERRLFVGQKLEPSNSRDKLVKIFDRACDLEYERTFRRDAGRIGAKR